MKPVVAVDAPIYINARAVEWSRPTITYADVLDIWRGFDCGRGDEGPPGIDWRTRAGACGTLYPSDAPMVVVLGLAFTVDVLVYAPGGETQP
ncbi:MAG: hypothetical protein OXH75_28780 [Acidobacteria bacterium]|nr:hypothetical protein [Acidobacteriota bacterium]